MALLGTREVCCWTAEKRAMGAFKNFFKHPPPIAAASSIRSRTYFIQFYQFLRDRSTTLPDEERRAFAEKVAMQFYNAIGGEETSGEEE